MSTGMEIKVDKDGNLVSFSVARGDKISYAELQTASPNDPMGLSERDAKTAERTADVVRLAYEKLQKQPVGSATLLGLCEAVRADYTRALMGLTEKAVENNDFLREKRHLEKNLSCSYFVLESRLKE